MSDKARADRALSVLLYASVAAAVLTLLVALYAVPLLRTSVSSNELAACRALARTEVDLSLAEAIGTKANLDALTNEGFEAVIREDNDALLPVLARARERRAEVYRSAQDLLDAAAEFRGSIQLSVDDPGRFVARCRDAND